MLERMPKLGHAAGQPPCRPRPRDHPQRTAARENGGPGQAFGGTRSRVEQSGGRGPAVGRASARNPVPPPHCRRPSGAAGPLARSAALAVLEIERAWEEKNHSASMDTLERSDREQDIGDWLDERGVAEAWTLAPDLVEAGAELAVLKRLPGNGSTGRRSAMSSPRLAGSFTITRLSWTDRKQHGAVFPSWSAPSRNTPTWTRCPSSRLTSTTAWKTR